LEDQLFELMLSKMDDLKERHEATHKLVTEQQERTHSLMAALDEKVEKHIKDDQILARDVWFIRRAFNAMWVGIVGLGTLYLGWKGLGQK
jgi:hypothetical protein